MALYSTVLLSRLFQQFFYSLERNTVVCNFCALCASRCLPLLKIWGKFLFFSLLLVLLIAHKSYDRRPVVNNFLCKRNQKLPTDRAVCREWKAILVHLMVALPAMAVAELSILRVVTSALRSMQGNNKNILCSMTCGWVSKREQ